MTIIKDHDNLLLMKKMKNDGQTNLSKWFEMIVAKFYGEQSIKEHIAFNEVKYKFCDDLNDTYMCIVPTIIFKFLIDKVISHIVKPQPPLAIPCCINWNQQIIEWKYFLIK